MGYFPSFQITPLPCKNENGEILDDTPIIIEPGFMTLPNRKKLKSHIKKILIKYGANSELIEKYNY